MFNDWLPFAIYGLFALVIPATMIVASFVFAQRPHAACAARTIPFESGVSQGPPQRQRFTVSFYLTAMLFILFDIEIVFLYPLAVILQQLAWFGFFEFLDVPRRSCSSRTSTSGGRERSNGTETSACATTGLKSERLLWPTKGPGRFEDEVDDLEQKVGLTTLEKAVAWAQTNSMWPDTFGLACCAIEMMSIVSARYDIARFGMEAFRGSPRQADLLIVSGRVSHKMAAPLRQIYDQMLEPKWVIAMGACASSGGMFNNYAIVQSVDKIVARRHVRARLPAAARAADGGDHPPARGGAGRRAAGVRAAERRLVSDDSTEAGTVPGLVEVTRAARRDDARRRRRQRSIDAALHLRDELGFNFLSDITAVDYLGWGERRRLGLHRHAPAAAT